MPKNLGVDIFADPIGHFGPPGDHIDFAGVAGDERVPPLQLGWYSFLLMVQKQMNFVSCLLKHELD